MWVGDFCSQARTPSWASGKGLSQQYLGNLEQSGELFCANTLLGLWCSSSGRLLNQTCDHKATDRGSQHKQCGGPMHPSIRPESPLPRLFTHESVLSCTTVPRPGFQRSLGPVNERQISNSCLDLESIFTSDEAPGGELPGVLGLSLTAEWLSAQTCYF